MQTRTFTFSEAIENHAGMEVIGKKATEGVSIEELKKTQAVLQEKKYVTEMIDLNKLLPSNEQKEAAPAAILIIRKAVEGKRLSDLVQEVKKFDVDKKAFMKGRVVNKLARYNICIADFSQEPDYGNKKGRVVDFKDTPILRSIREELSTLLCNEKMKNLNAELNDYYDLKKCGIGWHGDTERRLVVGLRLGAKMNLKYMWFKESKAISEPLELWLEEGDMYIMSDKAVGYDWKKRKIATLRHSAGAEKYTKKPVKKAKV